MKVRVNIDIVVKLLLKQINYIINEKRNKLLKYKIFFNGVNSFLFWKIK